MNATPTKPKNYLSPADRQRIKDELRQLEARRRATEDVPVGDHTYIRPSEVGIDDEALAARQRRLRHRLETESPPKLSGIQKNAAYREFKTLVREFEDNALTKFDQGVGYPEIDKKRSGAREDFERATKKCTSWEMAERGSYVCNRLKDLAGVLDADSPELRNLENFRRRK